MRILIILAIITVFVWGNLALLRWGTVSDFEQQITLDTIKGLLSSDGLQICKEKTITFDTLAGFTEGKTFSVSTDCATDTEPLTISVIGFDSLAARTTAMQQAQTIQRNGFGHNFAYNLGPYIITIDGPRGIEEQTLVGQILHRAGATP